MLWRLSVGSANGISSATKLINTKNDNNFLTGLSVVNSRI